MSVFHPAVATCSCGATFPGNVARSVNGGRNPASRSKIISGEMNRTICPSCGKTVVVEHPLFYTDFMRNAVYLVTPRSNRYQYKHHSRTLDKATAVLPAKLSDGKSRELRVVYGFDELKEKLLAQDAGLDDRLLELIKVLLIYEHPFLTQKTRLQVSLAALTARELKFIANHHNRQEVYEVGFPRSIVDDLVERRTELEAWVKKAHKKASLFDLPDHWVNFRRWTVRYSALDALRAAAMEINAGKVYSLTSAGFKRMVKELPRANQLPGWAKRDLRTVFEYARKKGNDAAALALEEVRFGIELENEWATNRDRKDLDTIWQLLAALPVTNVEGNTSLRRIDLIAGGGGTFWEGQIEIGSAELKDKESFEDVLRHEVGHAVHEQMDTVVDAWLKQSFGWQHFPASLAGADAWIALMGGWGANITAAQKGQMRQWLIAALGSGSSWDPGPQPRAQPGHPWLRDGYGPRVAMEQSTANWFSNYPKWYRANGYAFCLNYWYAEFMVVKASVLDDLVTKMPSSYAAMSRWEFFAEMYALYYDADDPMRKNVPPAAAQWLDANIGKPVPGNPAPPGAKPVKAKKKAVVKKTAVVKSRRTTSMKSKKK